MAGLFDIFSVGVRGMTSQQTALNVTSHNISNANTEGYSRQIAKIETTRPQTVENGTGQLGTGSEVTAVTRVRDTFIDYQIRNYTTVQGQFTSSEKYLSEIQGIMNEPGDTGIANQMSKFFSDWQSVTDSTKSSLSIDSATLADTLNSTYTQLQNVKENVNKVIQSSVADVNDLLDKVKELNKKIELIDVSGNQPNDLMDKRDLLLDELSSKFGIKVDDKSNQSIAVGAVVTVDPTNPSNVDDPFANSPIRPDGSSVLLVNNEPGGAESRFSYISDIQPVSGSDSQFTVTYYKNGNTIDENNKVTFNIDLGSDLGISGTITQAQKDVVQQRLKDISENRVLWANSKGTATSGDGSVVLDGSKALYNYKDLKMFVPVSGELKGLTAVQQDSDRYIDKLNAMAKGLAFAVNAIHSGVANAGTTVSPVPAATTPPTTQTADYLPYFVNSDVAKKNYDINGVLQPGTALNNVLSAESEITAGNISVNKTILNNPRLIKTKLHDDQFAYTADNTIDGVGEESRAKMIADLKNNFIDFTGLTKDGTMKKRGDLFTIGHNTLSESAFGNDSTGVTINTYFNNVIDDIGTMEQTAKKNIKNQQLLLNAFNQSKQSVSGVSLDEEMANLVQYQHAYQANAKVISTVDQLLDVVVNGLKK